MSGSKIIKSCVQNVQHLLKTLLTTKVSRAQQMREIIVWVAGVEGSDKVGEGPTILALAKGAEGTRS